MGWLLRSFKILSMSDTHEGGKEKWQFWERLPFSKNQFFSINSFWIILLLAKFKKIRKLLQKKILKCIADYLWILCVGQTNEYQNYTSKQIQENKKILKKKILKTVQIGNF